MDGQRSSQSERGTACCSQPSTWKTTHPKVQGWPRRGRSTETNKLECQKTPLSQVVYRSNGTHAHTRACTCIHITHITIPCADLKAWRPVGYVTCIQTICYKSANTPAVSTNTHTHDSLLVSEDPGDILRNTDSDPLGVTSTQPITAEKPLVAHLISRALTSSENDNSPNVTGLGKQPQVTWSSGGAFYHCHPCY